MPVYAESQTHEKVQAALDWALPVNACIKPKMIAVSSEVIDSEGSRSQTDVDSYTIERYERKEKRWKSCVEKYKSGHNVEFSELKDCAQYGLTKAQADIILGKMALIQSVYLSPDGRIDAP
jgi:hypothetical protein